MPINWKRYAKKKCPVCGEKIVDTAKACLKHRDNSKSIGNKKAFKSESDNYSTIHKWLVREYGKATRCENKKCDHKSKIFEWANIKGIKRERKNFIMLCKSCHMRFDRWKQEIDI
jgi:hypothetical protein